MSSYEERSTAVSFVSARDIADVAADVLTPDGPDGAIHTLTGPRSLTHAEIADRLGAAAGSDIRSRRPGGAPAWGGRLDHEPTGLR
ncbi:hypothetical protein [Nonomuraea sp. NPDC050786]|uniref:hypothetical protein n=1 Tax=Nonomuraea sp. NPDC050786 TaxID=3154840 RepID=UPI00341131C3